MISTLCKDRNPVGDHVGDAAVRTDGLFRIDLGHVTTEGISTGITIVIDIIVHMWWERWEINQRDTIGTETTIAVDGFTFTGHLPN